MSLRNIFELRKASICHSHAGGNPESASNTLDPRIPSFAQSFGRAKHGNDRERREQLLFVRVFLCALTNFRI